GEQLDVGVGGTTAVAAQHQPAGVGAVEHLVEFASDEFLQRPAVGFELVAAGFQRGQDAGRVLQHHLARRTGGGGGGRSLRGGEHDSRGAGEQCGGDNGGDEVALHEVHSVGEAGSLSCR